MNKQSYEMGSYGKQTNQLFSDDDIRGLLLKLLDKWYILLVCLALAVFAARFYLNNTEKEYSASTKILIKSQDQKNGGGASGGSLISDLFGMNQASNLLNETHILKSRSIMQQVVENLELNIAYFEPGNFVDRELYGNSPVVLDTILWNGPKRNVSLEVEIVDDYQFQIVNAEEKEVFQFGKPFAVGADTFVLNRNLKYENTEGIIRVDIFTTEFLASRLLDNLSIYQVEDFSSVINLTFNHPQPRKAVNICNELVRVYNRDGIEDKKKMDRKTLEFLTQRLALLTSELATVESNVALFKQENEIPTEAGASVDLLMTEISGYKEKQVKNEIQMDLLRSIENIIVSDSSDYELIPANVVLDDRGGLSQQIVGYNELVLKRQRIARSASADNPMLQSLDQQLANLRSYLIESIQTAQSDLEMSMVRNKSTLDDLKGRINTVPRLEKELLEIKRQQNIKEGLYLYLLQKKEEIALSSAVVPANAKVVDAAIMYEVEMVKPRFVRVYGTFLLLGLILPIGIITWLYYRDDKIYSEEEISRLTNIPFAGVVGLKKGKDKIVVKKNNNSPIAEMLRMIRTNLAYLASRNDFQTIMITSTTAGEGKTFLSMNLGMSLALTGKKVVILGMDLRKPMLRNNMEGESDQRISGISNFLVESVPVDSIIYPSSHHENLFYMPSGPIPPNPSEILHKPKVTELFDYLKEIFDVVIIDTAPIGLVTDSFLLYDRVKVDVTLVSVFHGSTPKGAVKFLEKEYQNGKLVQPAIVLNGFPLNKSKRYGGYGYGYGYGYGNGKKKKYGFKKPNRQTNKHAKQQKVKVR